MYKRIMVPLDGTTFAEQALPYAISIANKAGCGIDLAVVEALPANTAPDVWVYLEPLHALEVGYIEGVANQVRDAGVTDVTAAVLEGRPAETLEEYRAKIGADLTVMSTHGRGPISRAWLGSVADDFARRTSAAVMMVRPAHDTETVDLSVAHDFDQVLVTVDGSPMSEEAINPAVGLGQLYHATTTLLHLVEYPHETESVYLPDAVEAIRDKLETHRAAAEAELGHLAKQFYLHGYPVVAESRVVMHVAEGILEAAEEKDADVIVMASHGRGGVRRLVLGSVTDKVLRGANRPVMIIRTEMN
jgi:nucleotide-binding universal stress UspA family protein